MDIQLYIHIPFCVRKCAYCDFTSTDTSSVPPSEYVDAVITEMREARGNVPEQISAVTLYFGGGTPSLLEPRLIERIITAASCWYGLTSGAEITLEANPGTVNAARCRDFLATGINRLSLGVQSFDDALLRTLGRVHSASEAIAAFRAAETAGFASIGIDLIHSLPGQTVTMVEADVRQVAALHPTHVSAYGLTVEPETPFGRLWEQGELQLPSEDESVEMFLRVSDSLVASGYEHYEISNFATPGCRSRHNEGYWRRRTYLGFGAGAHSFVADPGTRWGNIDDIAAYVEAVRTGLPHAGELVRLEARDAMAEFMFLGLRLLEGVSLQAFARTFGMPAEAVFPHIEGDVRAGLLVREGDILRLAESAILLSNQIFNRFV